MKVLFAFNPEEGGHTSRSIAIGNELKKYGVEIWFAGSRKGLEFVKANEFPYYEFENLKFRKHIMAGNYGNIFFKFPHKVLKQIKVYKKMIMLDRKCVTHPVAATLQTIQRKTPTKTPIHK